MLSYRLKKDLLAVLALFALVTSNMNVVNASLSTEGVKAAVKFLETLLKSADNVSKEVAADTVATFQRALDNLVNDSSADALKLRNEIESLVSSGNPSSDKMGSIFNRVLYHSNASKVDPTKVVISSGVDAALSESLGIRYAVSETSGSVRKVLQKVADQSVASLSVKARAANKKAGLMSDVEFETLLAVVGPKEMKTLYTYFALAAEGSEVEKRLAKSLAPTVLGYAAVRDTDEVMESVEILFIPGSDALKVAWADMLDQATKEVPGDAGQVIGERTEAFQRILAERASKDPETAQAYESLRKAGCFNLVKS